MIRLTIALLTIGKGPRLWAKILYTTQNLYFRQIFEEENAHSSN